MSVNWDLPTPFVQPIKVVSEDIDELGHANNAVYVRWLERCAWEHSKSLGLGLAEYRELDRAMAVLRHEIDYLASAYEYYYIHQHQQNKNHRKLATKLLDTYYSQKNCVLLPLLVYVEQTSLITLNVIIKHENR